SFNKNIKLLFGASFLLNFAHSAVWLLTNFLFIEYGYNQAQLGLLNALPSFSVFICIPIGILIDKYNLFYKNFLLLGSILTPLSLLGIVLFSKFYCLVLMFFVSGLALGLFNLVASPFMMENSIPNNRNYLFSLQFCLGSLAGFLGSALSGYLPKIFSFLLNKSHQLILLKYTFIAMAGIEFLAFIPICFIASPLKNYINEKEIILKEKVRYILDKTMLKLLIPIFILGLGAAQVMPFLNIFIKGKFHLNYIQLGWIFAFGSLFVALATLAQPILSDKMGKINSVILVQAISIPFIFILGFSNIFWLVGTALLIRGALMNMGNPIYNVFAMENLSSNQRVTFSSLELFLWNIGWAVSSWFSGIIRFKMGVVKGFSINFILMATLYLFCTSLIYLYFGRQRGNKAAAS
ncbi:MAG: MFS transporter, partial [Armatimonadetes bacterium]|nr:MFS transporter [Armatimonadota bacterium]